MLKLLKITQIVHDKSVYPRDQMDWMTAHKYAEAMRAGAKFPPILVTPFRKRFVVLDGWHRLSAQKKIKEEYIQAEIIKIQRSRWFEIALERNVAHGRNLSQKERAQAIIKLEELGYPKITIANLVKIPIDKLEAFVINRLVTTPAGGKIIIKAPLKNLAGVVIENKEEFETEQRIISSQSQSILLKEVIRLLKNNWINIKDEEIKEHLRDIYRLLKRRFRN